MSSFAQADARRRITLPSITGIKPGDPVEIDIQEDGRVIITPVIAIPRSQAWAWQAEVRKRIAESLKDPRPNINLSAPGALDGLAARLGVNLEEGEG